MKNGHNSTLCSFYDKSSRWTQTSTQCTLQMLFQIQALISFRISLMYWLQRKTSYQRLRLAVVVMPVLMAQTNTVHNIHIDYIHIDYIHCYIKLSLVQCHQKSKDNALKSRSNTSVMLYNMTVTVSHDSPLSIWVNPSYYYQSLCSNA